jgi:hypothetical protein
MCEQLEMQLKKKKNPNTNRALVAHACNLGYLGGSVGSQPRQIV